NQQTHLARLINKITSEGGTSFSDTLNRKISANLQTVTASEWLGMIVVLALIAIYLGHRRRDWLRRVIDQVPPLRASLIGLAIAAGAAIIHNHVSISNTTGEEAAEAYLAAWRPVISARPDAILYPTVNFSGGSHNYDHIAPLARSGLLRMGLCDPGSVNLGRR